MSPSTRRKAQFAVHLQDEVTFVSTDGAGSSLVRTCACMRVVDVGICCVHTYCT